MNKSFRFPISLLIIIVFISSVSFYSPRKADKAKVYEPTKDFKFLNTEWVLSRCVTMAHWETNPDFTYDSAGIIMNKKTYHPVVISQYALTCFDAYMKSKDEKIKKKFLNQIKYLSNPKYYKQITDDVVGYPYTVNFHDMVAPWYSGLAQAEVLGVLVRYYYLTNDKNILLLMVQIKNMITLPVAKKGLLDTTQQGLVWIEEYPNSKQHAHVLNGFMVTVLLLDDYCKFFPGDTETRKLVDDCFISLKKSFSYYDTGSWLKYDRGTSSGSVNNWYMKAQVIEADHLYRLTKDDYFKRTSLLWSTYCYNKVVGYKGCIIDSVNYSIPLTLNADSTFALQTKYTDMLSTDLLKKVYINRIDTNKKATLLTDNNDNSVFKIKREKDQAEPPIIEMEFNSPIYTDQVALASAADLTGKVTFSCKIENKNKWKELSVKNVTYKDRITKFDIESKSISSIRIIFPQMDAAAAFDLGEIKLNTRSNSEPSDYVHYQTTEIKLTNDSEKLVFDKTGVSEFVVFYKVAPTSEALKKLKFSADSSTLNSFPVVTGKGKVVSFLIVLKRNNTANLLRNLKLEKLS